MTTLNLTAIDLGADSGRLVLGRFDGERVRTEALYRFDSHPVRLPTGLHTDVAHIWREISVGLQAVAMACSGRIDGVGVDTWGVDFALLDGDGGLLGLPYHYRDTLSAEMCGWAYSRVPREEIFAATGHQCMSINSLFQLLALAEQHPTLMQAARRLLFLPDLFTHWLGGDTHNERTIASTSQCYDPVQRDWAWIWLYRSGGAAPIGGTIATVSIAGTSWELHQGMNNKWNVFSYVRATNADTGATLNLGDFLSHLTKNRGMASSKYLSSVQAGTEVFLGSGRLDTDQYYCTIQ